MLFFLGGLFLAGPLILIEFRLAGGGMGGAGGGPPENEGRRKDAHRPPPSGDPDPVGKPQEH